MSPSSSTTVSLTMELVFIGTGFDNGRRCTWTASTA
jgi:hypothetical protein